MTHNETPDPILRGYNLHVSGLLARFMEYCTGPSSSNSSLHRSLQDPIHRQELPSSRLDVGADTFIFLGNFDTHSCHPVDYDAHQTRPNAAGSGLIHKPFFGLLAKNRRPLIDRPRSRALQPAERPSAMIAPRHR